jgi:hypothetical protein
VLVVCFPQTLSSMSTQPSKAPHVCIAWTCIWQTTAQRSIRDIHGRRHTRLPAMQSFGGLCYPHDDIYSIKIIIIYDILRTITSMSWNMMIL